MFPEAKLGNQPDILFGVFVGEFEGRSPNIKRVGHVCSPRGGVETGQKTMRLQLGRIPTVP